MKYLLCLSFLFLINSCKKDAPSPEENNNSTTVKAKKYRIKEGPMDLDNKTAQAFIEFDNDSNLKQVIIPDNNTEIKWTFNFEHRTLKSMYNHRTYKDYKVNVNAQNKITSIHEWTMYDQDEERINTYNLFYTYNNKQQIVSSYSEWYKYNSDYSMLISSMFMKHEYEYDTLDNIRKEIAYVKDKNGEYNWLYETNFNYDNKRNPYYELPINIIVHPFSVALFASKNNLIRKSQSDAIQNITLHYSYVYENDLPKSVEIKMNSANSGSSINSYSYIYDVLE